MTEYTVSMIDTTGIQNYIFGSNNLQHNVGASWLVHCATNDWVFEELVEMDKTNVDVKGNIDPDAVIENGSLNSELVYAGGGNTVILFRGKELAIKFTKQITRRVLVKAPGLQLVACHTDFDWDKPQLTQAVLDTVGDVNKKKYNRNVSSPVLGLGRYRKIK